MTTRRYLTALTIAGSDSGGGAGIQADLKTFSAIGIYGMSVLTALTAQNTKQVTAIYDVSSRFVTEQIDTVFEDMTIDAVKIGMLQRTDIIDVVTDRLIFYKPTHIVIDPVMVAKSKDLLLEPSAVSTLKQRLLPLATLLTPNIPEAEVLLNMKISSTQDMAQAALLLLELGPEAVVMKGGHLDDPLAHDLLLTKAAPHSPQWISTPRIHTLNTHGTGCTFSSAMTAYLASGLSIERAFFHAKDFISKAIQNGSKLRLGHGHGPVCHFENLKSI